MTTKITLVPAEISKAYAWTVYIQDLLKQKKMRNDVGGLADNASQILAGKLAEVAVCKFLGEEPNYAEGADGGKDLTFNGEPIDVKCTIRPNGRYLVWPKTKPLAMAADTLVGCTQFSADYDSAVIEIHGFVKRPDYKEFFKYAGGFEGLVKGTPYGLLAKLIPIEELKNI